MRYFLELSYNGKSYHGWQKQPNAKTIQEVIENALTIILKSPISIIGAGRTDAGVHAEQMFAHFDFSGDFSLADVTYKLNSYLPKDIAISNVFRVKHDAHARFDAISRTYNYRIVTTKAVFYYDYAYYIRQNLNLEAMQEACDILFEYKDFQCFSKSNTDVKTYHCDIKEAYFKVVGNEVLFIITADRFLRNMVRAIVGTLVSIGLGKLEVNDMHTIIKSKDRSRAGFSVPAHGLYLTKIIYPETIILND